MTSNQTSQKLAAKPIQYDIDERTWLEFRFKLENDLTLVKEKYVELLQHADSQPVANLPAREDERANPNAESHTVRLAGDTDHSTKLEAGAKSGEQKRVRSVETAGGGKRAEDRGSEIRDVASRATAGNGVTIRQRSRKS